MIVKGENVELAVSSFLRVMLVTLWLGIMLLGIGMGNFVVELVGDRKGVIYALCIFAPPVMALWVIVKYRKWIFKYVLWVLRRKGLLQIVNEK